VQRICKWRVYIDTSKDYIAKSWPESYMIPFKNENYMIANLVYELDLKI
jgi:hypothetical protein